VWNFGKGILLFYIPARRNNMKAGNHNQEAALAYSSRVSACFQDKQKHFSPAKK